MQPKFHTANLFAYKKSRKPSYKEIAQKFDISIPTAKRWIKKDIENGYILRERTKYKCKKYKALLHGRNIYHTTPKGRELIPQRSLKKKTLLKKSLLRSPSKSSLKSYNRRAFQRNSLKKEEKELLKKFGFMHLEKSANSWWFQNIKTLKKTLTLLRKKKSNGYRVKNEMLWISSCIKDGGRGYLYRKAKEYTLVITGNHKFIRKRRLFEKFSPRTQDFFILIKKLKSKGFKISFKEMMKLMRKGIPHLHTAIDVCIRALKKRVVHDINFFLNWIVGLKEPKDVFKKNGELLEKESTRDWSIKRTVDCLNKTLQRSKMKESNDIYTDKTVIKIKENYLSLECVKSRENVYFHFSETILTLFHFNEEWLKTEIDMRNIGAKKQTEIVLKEIFSVDDIEYFNPVNFGFKGEMEQWKRLRLEAKRILERMINQRRTICEHQKPVRIEDTPKTRLKIHVCKKKTKFMFFLFDRLEKEWKLFSFDAKETPGHQALRNFWVGKLKLSPNFLCSFG